MTKEQFLAIELKAVRRDLEIALEVLNYDASWDEGPEVTSSFDSPGFARSAREAIARMKTLCILCRRKPWTGYGMCDACRKKNNEGLAKSIREVKEAMASGEVKTITIDPLGPYKKLRKRRS